MISIYARAQTAPAQRLLKSCRPPVSQSAWNSVKTAKRIFMKLYAGEGGGGSVNREDTLQILLISDKNNWHFT
jgi:hypothetical protein